MDDVASSLTKKKVKGKLRGKPKTRKKPYREEDDVIMLDSEDESEDEDEDEDMEDFIVNSDEDEEEKDAKKAEKKTLGKRKAFVVLDSDEEEEIEEEEKEVLFGRKKPEVSPDAIKIMPRFLPSTKMKVSVYYISRISKTHKLLENDGDHSESGGDKARREGTTTLSSEVACTEHCSTDPGYFTMDGLLAACV